MLISLLLVYDCLFIFRKWENMEKVENTFDINKIIANVIQKSSEKILKKTTGILEEQAKKFSVDFNIAFKPYIQKSYDKYSKIKTLLYRTEPKFLYDFFECNLLMYNGNIFEAENINNILDISHFTIIRGTGGIGKSTLMKHLFLSELKESDLIPVFIELKEFKDGTINLYDFIFNSLKTLGFNLEEKYFEYALNSGCFVFLLDGYDEIPNNNESEFLKQLELFCDKYTENYFVLSSRPTDEFIRFSRFTVLDAQLFDKQKAINLINKIDYDNDIKVRFVKALEDNLYEKHHSFASNPLLLNIMLLTYENYAEIPDKLHLFYAQAFETLLIRHDANKCGFKRELKSNLTNDDFTKAFSKFCFLSFAKKKIEFPYADLKEFVTEAIPQNIDVNSYISDLLNAVCVIYRDGLNFKFTHRSFQEYFAAVYMKDLPDENQSKVAIKLIEHGYAGMYGEHVFLMLFDMSKERVERNIILPLAQEIDKNRDHSRDKFESYFLKLFSRIGFMYEHEALKIVRYRMNSESWEFMIRILPYYTEKNEHIHGIECEIKKELREKTKKKAKGIDSFYANAVIEDKALLDYIKTTWIGDIIITASSLIEKINENKKMFDEDIDKLIESL